MTWRLQWPINRRGKSQSDDEVAQKRVTMMIIRPINDGSNVMTWRLVQLTTGNIGVFIVPAYLSCGRNPQYRLVAVSVFSDWLNTCYSSDWSAMTDATKTIDVIFIFGWLTTDAIDYSVFIWWLIIDPIVVFIDYLCYCYSLLVFHSVTKYWQANVGSRSPWPMTIFNGQSILATIVVAIIDVAWPSVTVTPVANRWRRDGNENDDWNR